ncbi:Tetratricopeptide repeat superfamily protein [Perilla frutescens var. hirtella]|nr:Tetratricopeptide repeat superfamily protein [Perilla frutescens var. hirtella]
MRRASSKLLSHLRKPYPKTPLSLSTRDFAASSDHSLTCPPKSCSASQSLLSSTFNSNSCRFRTCLSRNLNTLVDPLAQNAQQMSGRQRKIKEKSELEEAFESAESLDEMLAAFKEMEACFDEKDLGLACLKIGLKLDREGDDPEKTLSFARRALEIFDENDDNNSGKKFPLPIAMALHLLGTSSYGMKRFSDSLGYLNRANRLLSELVGGNSYNADQVLPILHAVQFELFNVKTAMGRREEAIVDLRKALEIKEKIFEEDSKELGDANRGVAEAYVAVLDFKEALPFCLKALEIHKTHFGHNSVEVAFDRRVLGVIYTGLEEHEKALEQNQLSRKVLKNWGRGADLLRAEIDAANMQISLGRFEEAINTLKGVVQQTDKESEDRAMVFISMSKALCHQEKFADAKKCLEIACGILEKKERSSPLAVVESYMEISTQYETMNDFETAISLLKKALVIFEKLPQEQHSVGSVSARIGWLLLLTGKVEEAISYLEDAAERLKESFGSKHFAIGYVYNNLGAAYMELDRPQSAAQIFAYSKEIMDVSLGPHHADSIETCQNLSKAYAAMGSYPLAMNFQEKVVEGWEGHGPSAQDELNEAIQVLNQLKEKASTLVSETLLNAMPPPNEGDHGSSENPDSASSATKSHPRAINFQEEVVEDWEEDGPSSEDELNEAIQVLERLKEKARSSVSEPLLNAMPRPDKDEHRSAENPDSASSPMKR